MYSAQHYENFIICTYSVRSNKSLKLTTLLRRAFCRWKPNYIISNLLPEPQSCVPLGCLLLLQQEDSIHERFSRWGTSRNVDIDWNDSVTPADDRVRVVVVTTTVGTTSHRDDPSRLWHLVVDLSQSRSHFVCQCACHDHNITLSRRCSEDNSQPVLVVSWCGNVHHLDCTASKTESHWPDRSLSCPIDDGIGTRQDVVHCILGARFLRWQGHIIWHLSRLSHRSGLRCRGEPSCYIEQRGSCCRTL